MRKSSNPKYAAAKKQSLMMKCLDEKLVHLNDPAVPASQLCFTELKLSRDGSYCDVFVDCRKRTEIVNYVEILNHKANEFRSYLAQEVNSYKTPIVRFHADSVVDNVLKINQIFDELHKQSKS